MREWEIEALHHVLIEDSWPLLYFETTVRWLEAFREQLEWCTFGILSETNYVMTENKAVRATAKYLWLAFIPYQLSLNLGDPET